MICSGGGAFPSRIRSRTVLPGTPAIQMTPPSLYWPARRGMTKPEWPTSSPAVRNDDATEEGHRLHIAPAPASDVAEDGLLRGAIADRLDQQPVGV